MALPSPYRNSSAMTVLNSPQRFLWIKVHTKLQSFMREQNMFCSNNKEDCSVLGAFKSIKADVCLPACLMESRAVGICKKNSSLYLQLQVHTEQKHLAIPFLEGTPIQQLFLPFRLCKTLGESSQCLWASSSLTCILPERMKHTPAYIILFGSNQVTCPEYSRQDIWRATGLIIKKIFHFQQRDCSSFRKVILFIQKVCKEHCQRELLAHGRTVLLSYTYITLQFVGLLCMFHIELLRIPSVLVQRLPVVNIACKLLASLSMEESRLVEVTPELCPGLGISTPVFIVALEFPHSEDVPDFGIIICTEAPHLLASVSQEGFSVFVLQEVQKKISFSHSDCLQILLWYNLLSASYQ